MASVDSLIFDLADCRLVQQSDTARIWLSSDHVAYRLQFDSGVIYWPFDLTNPAAALEFYRRECEQNGGVMLEMDVLTAADADGLSGVFKYRSPAPDSVGMAYVGVLWLPFRDCRFQINVEAVETGATGMRECAVMMIEGDKWPMEPQEVIPVINSQEELDSLYAKAQVRQLPSDSPKYDASFPQHPLSQVRAGLARVIATAQLGPDARSLPPHRIGL